VKNIFVGNLSFNTNEDELRQAFEAYGQVERVSILTDRDTGRSRGFAFSPSSLLAISTKPNPREREGDRGAERFAARRTHD